MILDSLMLQSMVDKMIQDIGYNINIIDVDGTIIASGSKERIGTFHKTGKEAAETEKRIDIDQENIQTIGVKEGINQPFYYNKKLAGVIGITGKPKEIEEFVNVIKSMIELMIEQEVLKSKMYHRQSNKVLFINLLVNAKTEDEFKDVIRWANQMTVDITKPRCAILISIKNLLERCSNQGYGEDEEAIKNKVRSIIKSTENHQRDDVSAYITNDRILVLKTINGKKLIDRRKEIHQYIEEISEKSKSQFEQDFSIGIGSVYDEIRSFGESFREAEFALKKQLQANNQEVACSIEHCLLSYFFTQVESSKRIHFFDPYYEVISAKEELVETVIAFSMANMNILATSKALYVHRNTVISRLSKLKEVLGLDPLNSHKDKVVWDMLAIYLLSKSDTKN